MAVADREVMIALLIGHRMYHTSVVGTIPYQPHRPEAISIEPSFDISMFAVRTSAACLRCSSAARRGMSSSNVARRNRQSPAACTTTKTTQQRTSLRRMYSRSALERGAILQTTQLVLDTALYRGGTDEVAGVLEGDADDDGT